MVILSDDVLIIDQDFCAELKLGSDCCNQHSFSHYFRFILLSETEKYVNENKFIGILAGLKYSKQAKSRRQANQSKGLTLAKCK